MKHTSRSSRKKSLTWWGVILTGAALVVAIFAWLWPDPFKSNPNIIPTAIPHETNIISLPTKSPEKIRIMVLRFDEVSSSNYRMTDLIVAKLRDVMSKYSDTEIIFVDQVVTEKEGSEVALKLGEKYDASIVIWGWYGLTDRSVPLGVHFDVVPSSRTFTPHTCAASSSEIDRVASSHLKDLTLQISVSNELTYLTLFTLGLARFEADDYTGSLTYFNDAINNYDSQATLSAMTSDKTLLVDTDLLYDYRGNANLEAGNYDSALADFGKINEDGSHNAEIGDVYKRKGDYESALRFFDTVIEGDYSSRTLARSLYLRGTIKNLLGDKNQANQDFREAISVDEEATLNLASVDFADGNDTFYDYWTYYYPENFLVYYFRALAYEDKNADKSLEDYNKALDLFPDFPAARANRLFLIIANEGYDHQKVTKDLETLISFPEYRSPCYLVNLGREEYFKKNYELADKYYNEAVSRATDEINKDPNNAYAYWVRGIAWENLDQEEKAIRDYQEVIDRDPALAEKHGLPQEVYAYSPYSPIVIIASFIAIVGGIFLIYQFVLNFIKSRLRPRPKHTK